MRPARPALRWIAWSLLAASGAVLLWGAVQLWPRTVDDAFIAFRYAQNLADGLGPVYNPGERIEGYTSPSWLALMAAAIVVGIDPVPVSKGIGLAASALLLLALYRGLRAAEVPDWGAAAASTLLGASFVLQIWSVAGLETNTYALLLFAGLLALTRTGNRTRSVLWPSMLLVAATLTRPEGLVFWLAGGVIVIGTSRESRLRSLLAYTAPALLLVAHLTWRILYYGAPLPNTYYAKTGGGLALWEQGLVGLKLFAAQPAHYAWLLASAAGAVAGLARRDHRRFVLVLGGAVLLHLLYVIGVGDDGLRVHRFYVPVLAPLAFLTGLLFGPRAGRGRPWLPALGALTVALTVPLSVWTLQARMSPGLLDAALAYQEGNVKLGRYLGETRERGTWVATAAAGATPYYSRLPTIDMYGLNDPYIARRPFPASSRGRLMKWDNAYVLARQPDLIVINRGYFRHDDPVLEVVRRRPAALAAAPMDRDLFLRVAQDGTYALRPLRFADGSVFYVFERVSPRRQPLARR